MHSSKKDLKNKFETLKDYSFFFLTVGIIAIE